MKIITLPRIADKGVFALAVSQFGMAFANNFVMVIMPFYILKISHLSHQATTLWIGFIIAGAAVTTTLAAPFWGGMTARVSPKFLFERGLFCSALVILLMGFADNIYLLFVLRVLQGFVGGASTIGLILTASLSPPGRLRSNMSLFQNSITAGQLLGPPAGAYAVALLGYQAPFYLSCAMIFVFLIFCHRHVGYIPPQGEAPRTKASLKKSLLFGWFLCMIGTVHLNFIPPILPHILDTFRLGEKEALSAAGMIMMSYTASAIAGSYLICKISSSLGFKKVMILSLLMAALFQLLLVFSEGVRSFTVLRMLQCAFMAAIFPLTISAFARHVGGKAIGFLNSARFFGNAAGPLLATSVVAFADLFTLYLVIAGLTLGSLWFVAASMQREESEGGPVT